MKNCPICKGRIVDADDIVSDVQGLLFINSGTRCTSCGEEFLDEKEGQKMISIAKRMGVWGTPLKLHRKLSRSARGTMLRIPLDIEKNLGLKGTEEVSISKIGENRILVEIES